MSMIYSIKCLSSNRMYVGSTTKTGVHRWNQHINNLKSNRHENPILQRVYNKYKNLIFQELENVSGNNDSLIERERFHYNNLKSRNIDMMNIMPIVKLHSGYKWKEKSRFIRCGKNNPMYGKVHLRIGKLNPAYGKMVSDKTRKKLSIAGKGRIRNDVKLYLSKSIAQYTMDGIFVKYFDSIKQAGNELNTCVSHIGEVCSGSRKSCAGYIWKYKDSNDIKSWTSVENGVSLSGIVQNL